jgi:hypothetical protein
MAKRRCRSAFRDRKSQGRYLASSDGGAPTRARSLLVLACQAISKPIGVVMIHAKIVDAGIAEVLPR